MKNLLFVMVSVFISSFLEKAVSQSCNYTMGRDHANYFASAKGYNGYGIMPYLSLEDFKRMMTDEWHDYYENMVSTCSYCEKPSVLKSWGNCLAICNAANYYHNLFNANYNASIQAMDMEIQRLKSKKWD